MRLFAALGPGNIVEAQRRQLSRRPWSGQTSVIFSGQLYEYCDRRKMSALFTSHNAAADSLLTPFVKLINFPKQWPAATGWRYHLGQLLYAARLAWMARRFGADLALIDSGTTHYFALVLFTLLRVPVAVNLHNVRWPQGFPPQSRSARITRKLDSWFFRNVAVGALGCSLECELQARSDGAGQLPFFRWCGQYSAHRFALIEPPPPERNPFRVLFAGRIERNKGALDLLAIAQRLMTKCSIPVIIEVCGDGSALPELRAALAAALNPPNLVLRGHLTPDELSEAYSRAHAVIVPTRSDFCEGLPLVCAEAALSGRPIITTRLSNALPTLGTIVAEAQPDNVDSYVAAICDLAQCDAHYRKLQRACADASRQFLDRSQSYPAALDRLISELRPGWIALSSFESLFEGLT